MTLEDQLNSASPSASVTPKARSVETFTSLVSYDMEERVASTSSSMMRSYSVPAHTQEVFDDLRKRWDAEAATARSAANVKGKGRLVATIKRAFSDTLVPLRRSHEDLCATAEMPCPPIPMKWRRILFSCLYPVCFIAPP